MEQPPLTPTPPAGSRSEYLLPAPIKEPFNSIAKERLELIPKAEAAFARGKRTFFIYLVILVLWYLGQPFADPTVMHYLVQTIGVIVIALATGTLRVLKQIEGCLATLDEVGDRSLALIGELGVDFKDGVGDPIAITKKLQDETYLAKVKAEVAALAGEIKAVKSILRRGSFEAYLEMFAVVGRDPRDREKAKR